jgi:hypothetical protein
MGFHLCCERTLSEKDFADFMPKISGIVKRHGCSLVKTRKDRFSVTEYLSWRDKDLLCCTDSERWRGSPDHRYIIDLMYVTADFTRVYASSVHGRYGCSGNAVMYEIGLLFTARTPNIRLDLLDISDSYSSYTFCPPNYFWKLGSGRDWRQAVNNVNQYFGCKYEIGFRDSGNTVTFYLTESGRDVLWYALCEDQVKPTRRARKVCAGY